MIIKRKHLNNKSRRGWFTYVRHDGRGAYYKWKRGLTAAHFQAKFEARKQRKRGPQRTLSQYKQTRARMPRPAHGVEVTKTMRRGVFKMQLPNVHIMDENTVRQYTAQLLDKAIKIPAIRDIMLQPENLHKINMHFKYKLELEGSDTTGKHVHIATLDNKHGRIPYEIAQFIRHHIFNNMDINWEHTPPLQAFKEDNWRIIAGRNGLVNSTMLTVQLAKA